MWKRTLCLTLAVLLLLSVPGALAVTYRQGSAGEQVRTIQQKLKRWGYYDGAVDGIFGSAPAGPWCPFRRKTVWPPMGS